MQKIKVLSKDIDNNGENICFTVSLAENYKYDKTEYMVVSETKTDVSVIKVGRDFNFANILFKLFFEETVLPESVNEIIREVTLEQCLQLL